MSLDPRPEISPSTLAAARLGERLRRGHTMQKSPRRVYALLRAAIRSGELPARSKLDEGVLARELLSSRNAVRLALQNLALDGLVMRQPGVGTVVVSGINEFPIFECIEAVIGATAALTLLETRDVSTNAFLRSRFGESGTTLRMSEFLIRTDGIVVGIFSRYGLKPAPLLEAAEPVLSPSHISWYRRIHNEPPGDISVTVEATSADERTAELLGVPTGYALLVRETLYCDLNMNPAELHIAHFDSRKAAVTANVATLKHAWKTA
ncbi:GntR family transcriptional regulator [Glaciihabitans tibetensis]|uniref:GntR family transcriptional regulator n=1 Tax=Glaciihabitans tibetensis TaxID=1266600 RepID=A0A2T0VDU3_9MICO|nr:GntR family transcriptional regulator [Glaciihabitans tibetensis]PRY68354.1 GntR family transcriptional regulator [Glaciihabitans tibetensis]